MHTLLQITIRFSLSQKIFLRHVALDENVAISFLKIYNYAINWLIYSFVVLTSNMSTPCGSIYWCLYRKILRGKKTHIFRLSLIAFRNSFESLSTHINSVFFFICYSVISWCVSFNDRCLIRSEDVRELM